MASTIIILDSIGRKQKQLFLIGARVKKIHKYQVITKQIRETSRVNDENDKFKLLLMDEPDKVLERLIRIFGAFLASSHDVNNH